MEKIAQVTVVGDAVQMAPPQGAATAHLLRQLSHLILAKHGEEGAWWSQVRNYGCAAARCKETCVLQFYDCGESHNTEGSEGTGGPQLQRITRELLELQTVLRDLIQRVTERGARLDSLSSRAAQLSRDSGVFERRARSTRGCLAVLWYCITQLRRP